MRAAVFYGKGDIRTEDYELRAASGRRSAC